MEYITNLFFPSQKKKKYTETNSLSPNEDNHNHESFQIIKTDNKRLDNNLNELKLILMNYFNHSISKNFEVIKIIQYIDNVSNDYSLDQILELLEYLKNNNIIQLHDNKTISLTDIITYNKF